MKKVNKESYRFVCTLDYISTHEKEFKNFIWSAVDPVTQKTIEGKKMPTEQEQYYQNFAWNDTFERKSIVRIGQANKYNKSREGQYKVTWNDNDDGYEFFWFKTLTEALDFKDILHSCIVWDDLLKTLEDSQELFDYERD